MCMHELFDRDDKKKIEHPLRSYPITFEGLVRLPTFEVKTITCICGKCGAELSGQIVVENIGGGCFAPVNPDYGGMDRSMTVHHTETNDGGGDGEHRLFFIKGDITGFAFVSGQGCGVIKPGRQS